jgi:hypothetical protein
LAALSPCAAVALRERARFGSGFATRGAEVVTSPKNGDPSAKDGKLVNCSVTKVQSLRRTFENLSHKATDMNLKKGNDFREKVL